MKKIDLTGQRFGRLVVIEPAPKQGKRSMWKCRCDCGATTIAALGDLRSGHTTSCGCYAREATAERNHTHGHTKRPKGKRRIPRIYNIWEGMKQRCGNPNVERYPHYGGRGIKVCQEWADSFEAFYSWAMSHGYDDTKEIDRIDNDGDYTPDNCRWVPHESQQNNKGNTVKITCFGQTRTLSEWASITGIRRGTIWQRLKRGKSPEEALKIK